MAAAVAVAVAVAGAGAAAAAAARVVPLAAVLLPVLVLPLLLTNGCSFQRNLITIGTSNPQQSQIRCALATAFVIMPVQHTWCNT